MICTFTRESMEYELSQHRASLRSSRGLHLLLIKPDGPASIGCPRPDCHNFHPAKLLFGLAKRLRKLPRIDYILHQYRKRGWHHQFGHLSCQRQSLAWTLALGWHVGRISDTDPALIRVTKEACIRPLYPGKKYGDARRPMSEYH